MKLVKDRSVQNLLHLITTILQENLVKSGMKTFAQSARIGHGDNPTPLVFSLLLNKLRFPLMICRARKKLLYDVDLVMFNISQFYTH